jgi:hypothetical protein
MFANGAGGHGGLLEPPELSAVVPTSVESRTTFRLARLLLFVDVARETGRPIPSVDRLGYYEFFADNPFMIIGEDRRANRDRLALEMSGFSPLQLSYASTGQRFASRRQRLQHDLSLLVSRDLITIEDGGFTVTDAGAELADRLNSVYADAYRTSARIVLRRLASMSNKALEEASHRWLGESWLLIDLLDEIQATDAPELPPAKEVQRPHSQSAETSEPSEGNGDLR